jgi:hypothetical protein
MRKVRISEDVWNKLDNLADYIVDDFKLSEEAAMRRIDRLLDFLYTLSNPADYALCRFKRWNMLGYRCAIFEGWVFAYETFNNGVIVRDMAYGATLIE